jgi:hypothetical protein
MRHLFRWLARGPLRRWRDYICCRCEMTLREWLAHFPENPAVRPFEFIIVLFSFIYTLGLTHLLFAATRMIRHRRIVVFSWPHVLWMAAAPFLLAGNWLSLWDFHTLQTISLTTIAGGFGLVVINAAAGTGLGIQNWGNQNWIVLAMLPAAVAPLLTRDRVVQVLAPLVMRAIQIAYPIIYYPVLK